MQDSVAWLGWKGSVRDYRPAGNGRSHVNPIRSKIKKKTIGLPGLSSGGSLDVAGNSHAG